MPNKQLQMIKVKNPQRNNFDLTHDVKFSCKFGELIPVMASEVLPGDNFKIGCDTLVRFAPMLAPIMHRLDVFTHYFFVPNRLTWPNWEKFIAGDETVNAPYLDWHPGLTPNEQKHASYFGVAKPNDVPGATETVSINALPFAAYNKIYNEYYRDQNLVTELDAELNDGLNILTPYKVTRKRAWEHDYFTSCLPWAQKGSAVDIPLGTVQLKTSWVADGDSPYFTDGTITPTGTVAGAAGPQIDVGITTKNAYDPDGSLETSPTTINDLRRAFRLQEWLEKNARGGTRYIELIRSHFAVRSSDARLQRPEYITGSKSPVSISEVLNTTGESGGNVQGNMAGHGVSVNQGIYGRYKAEEHGWIIGIMSIMPKPAYFQGIQKKFLKLDYLDYFWPEFAHIGEQEVTNEEIYGYQVGGPNTFGYQSRYAEYRFEPNRVAGDFTDSLEYWHLARKFGAAPALNQTFIEVSDTVDDLTRIFAVEDGTDYLWCHILHKVTASRKIPYYGTPML